MFFRLAMKRVRDDTQSELLEKDLYKAPRRDEVHSLMVTDSENASDTDAINIQVYFFPATYNQSNTQVYVTKNAVTFNCCCRLLQHLNGHARCLFSKTQRRLFCIFVAGK